jgi:transmembrane sensor
MEETRFWILAAKKISGELTTEETRELELLLLSNSNYRNILLSLQNPGSQNAQASSFNKDELLQRLRVKLNVSSPDYLVSTNDRGEISPKSSLLNLQRVRSRAILISLLILITAGFFSWRIFFNKTTGFPIDNTSNTISTNNTTTKPGSKTQIKLPDGTIVVLNSDSKLIYPDNFLGNTRDVTLEGEAFFEVTHDKEKPFIIHSKTMDIKVLGTVFNVKAYPDETTTEATLIKGSIEVTIKNKAAQKIMLKPSEKIIVRNNIIEEDNADSPPQQPATEENTPLISVKEIEYDGKDSVATDIAWLQNKLVFSNETFENIVLLLERRFSKKITIKTDNLKYLTFTGKFDKENIDQILKALQLTHKFNYKEENDTITIY